MNTVNECLAVSYCRWKLKVKQMRGAVKVHSVAGIHFSVIRFERLRLYGGTCNHRKTANRQARMIAQRLGLEVVK